MTEQHLFERGRKDDGGGGDGQREGKCVCQAIVVIICFRQRLKPVCLSLRQVN